MLDFRETHNPKKFVKKQDYAPENSAMGRTARAFTLFEMLIVVGVIITLAMMIVPLFSKLTLSAKNTKSISNLRQIGIAFNGLIAEKGNNEFPLATGMSWSPPYWMDHLETWLPDSQPGPGPYGDPGKPRLNEAFYSPTEINSAGMGDYGINSFLMPPGLSSSQKVTLIRRPARTVMVCDARSLFLGKIVGAWYFDAAQWVNNPVESTVPYPAARYKNQVNALFCDGHIEALELEQLKADKALREELFLND